MRKFLTEQAADLAIKLSANGVEWSRIRQEINFKQRADILRAEVFHYQATGKIKEHKPVRKNKTARADDLRFIK